MKSFHPKKKTKLKGDDIIKRPSKKPDELYKPLLDKGLEHAQIQYLAEYFDLSKVSWLSRKTSKMFNSLMDEYEKSIGIKRLYPGDLKVSRLGKSLVLPLCPTSLLENLARGERMEEAFDKHCDYLLDVLKKSFPNATISDVHILVNQRSLLPCRRQKSRPGVPMPPLDINALIKSLPQVNLKNSIVPAAIRETIVSSLLPDGVCSERANAIVDALSRIRNNFCPLLSDLQSGQVVWTSISVKDRQQDDFYNMFRHQVPVILTLYTPEEIVLLTQPNITLKLINELHRRRIARMCFEAYRQGGLLSTLDLQMLVMRSRATICRLINEFEQANNIIIPTPGSIKDAGRKFTHKHIVIDLHLQGYLTKEIAQKTYHSGPSVDRYIDGFLRVMALELFNVPPRLIARTTHMGLSLVEEYHSIIKEHFADKKVLQDHLRKHGVEIS